MQKVDSENANSLRKFKSNNIAEQKLQKISEMLVFCQESNHEKYDKETQHNIKIRNTFYT